MINSIERHIFKDCDDFFNLKHDTFIDSYLYECILGGDGLNHSDIKEIDFIKNPSFEPEFCIKILNGIINSNPLIKISHYSKHESNSSLDIFYINNHEDFEDFFCVTKTEDFMVEGTSIFQIYEVKVKSLDMINEFWLTSKADLAEW